MPEIERMPPVCHGIDVVEVARIQQMLVTHGRRFISRCFTPGEEAYAEMSQKRRAERYAVRFACKEAVFKALGTGWSGGVRWRDVEVTSLPSGQPILNLSGHSAELAGRMGITHWRLSLSHTGSIALASVIGCGTAGVGARPP